MQEAVRTSKSLKFVGLVLICFVSFCCWTFGCWGKSQSAHAEIEYPDDEYLFPEDRNEEEKAEEVKSRRSGEQSRREGIVGENPPLDIDAPTLNYDSTTSTFQAEGGLVITHGLSVIEAERGSLNSQTGETILEEDVRISDPQAQLTASDAQYNVKTKTGELHNTEMHFTEGDYRLKAKRIQKKEGLEFHLDDALMTTCDCPDGDLCAPWRIRANEADITVDGYGITKGTIFEVRDRPVFYLPYLIFPVKAKRQTGLLPATIGNSSRHGFHLELPFFWAIDNSTDATITPLVEVKTRVGVDTEFRKIFSLNHELELGATYLNESARDGELRGTDVTDLSDPSIDENRFAGYLDQNFSGDVGEVPVQVVLDGNYVSDDLILREFEKQQIGDKSSRYVTSRGVVRGSLFDSHSVDLAVEYNQALVTNDDDVFQRLPEFTVNGVQRFRPFGINPYGLQLIVSDHFESIAFDRDSSFDGSRTELYEKIRIPFYLGSYLENNFEVGARASHYTVNYNQEPEPSPDGGEVPVLLESSSDRVVPEFNFSSSTNLERVFEVSQDSWLKRMVDLGSTSREVELLRVKHLITPVLEYKYVPEVDQDDNPQFDSNDQLAKKNVVTYGVVQRLYSRHEARNPYLYGVEEVTPEFKDLKPLASTGVFEDTFGLGLDTSDVGRFSALDRGNIYELASFSLTQSFDIEENSRDLEEGEERREFSDVDMEVTFHPNNYIGIEGEAGFDVEDQGISSYSIGTQLLDKRGDEVRALLSFVEDNVRQLESNVALRLTERLQVGYYTRYDDLAGDVIESKVGLRLKSACKCWVFDVDLTDQSNPDDTRFGFTLTLVGLGEISHKLFALDKDQQTP